MANPDKIERKWYVVDADGCTLGHLASGVASVLQVITLSSLTLTKLK